MYATKQGRGMAPAALFLETCSTAGPCSLLVHVPTVRGRESRSDEQLRPLAVGRRQSRSSKSPSM